MNWLQFTRGQLKGQSDAVNLNQAYDELWQLVERINLELNFVEVLDQLEAEVE